MPPATCAECLSETPEPLYPYSLCRTCYYTPQVLEKHRGGTTLVDSPPAPPEEEQLTEDDHKLVAELASTLFDMGFRPEDVATLSQPEPKPEPVELDDDEHIYGSNWWHPSFQGGKWYHFSDLHSMVQLPVLGNKVENVYWAFTLDGTARSSDEETFQKLLLAAVKNNRLYIDKVGDDYLVIRNTQVAYHDGSVSHSLDRETVSHKHYDRLIRKIW